MARRQLTERERIISKALREGRSLRRIARDYHITVARVRSIIKRIRAYEAADETPEHDA